MIFINATSLGLKPNDDFIFETIYNPLSNKIKILNLKKLKTFNGLNMLIYQGQKEMEQINIDDDIKLLETNLK